MAPFIIVGLLYECLLFCLGCFIYEAITAWRHRQIKAWRLAGSLLASIPFLGCLVLSLGVVLAPPFFILLTSMAILMHTPTDQELINQQFTPHLPGFQDIKVLQREEEYRGIRQVITLTVTINGYPDKRVCQGSIHYRQGDPSVLYIAWPDKQCEEQYLLVREAQYMLNQRSAQYPLAREPDVIAHLLVTWIRQGRISLSDIQQPEMRSLVTHLLDQEGQR